MSTGGSESPKHKPGRPPTGSEDKRERVLDESLRLFTHRGYAGTSLSDIAREADISKAGLLHHFPTKDALFAAVLERRDQDAPAPSPETWNLDEFLDSWIGIARRNAAAPEGVALYTAMSGAVIDARHPAHHWFSEHLAHTITTITTVLERATRTGQLVPETPSESLARALVALSDGLQVQWLCARADSGTSENDHGAAHQPYDTDMVAETRAAAHALIDPWRMSQGNRPRER